MEIRKKDVANAMYEGKKLLGHLAIELLIDKVKGTPTDDWLETIIEIAGDPRVANTATNYRKWWLPIGQEKIAKVRGWLAKEDLKLFLKAVDEYGKLAGDKDLLRMFPARKKFLEGLFEQGLVRNARLMLGTEAAGYVKKALDKDYQINHILLTGGLKDKAVIYLDCSNFYIVEGSHNFKIWVYLAKPTNIFDSYSPNFSLEYSDLTSSVIKSYLTKFPNWPYVGVTHNNNWLNNVIDFLYTNGRKVELEDIMSKVDYPKYLERYGQPYLKKSKFN
ncbi:hypothetical protein GCM10007878_23980 [Marinospirillum insulare]|uniref:Zorya protein ZorC EH domain-containing protein n=2 Tax=Marinospirillum insulare TaxID=217169 RepID=A0ABQ5ZXP5_9GAMM|nr:hypothetical protein GCM10007878_23980 [Marinospirillum insulare]